MNDAEQLIGIADAVLHPSDALLVCEGEPECVGDVVALALRLRSKPDVALRAMVEEWTRFRIVRELH